MQRCLKPHDTSNESPVPISSIQSQCAYYTRDQTLTSFFRKRTPTSAEPCQPVDEIATESRKCKCGV
eukprot:871161-Amphidinium_carterae.1